LHDIADRAFDTTVHSFRRGRIGGWREHFKAHHVAAFKRVANWALVHYQYERDDGW